MIHLPGITIFFAIYILYAFAAAFVSARNDGSEFANWLVIILVVVGGIDVLGGLTIVNSSGWYDGLLFASGPLSATVLFLGIGPVFFEQFRPHPTKTRIRKPEFRDMAYAAGAVILFSLICWAHVGNALRSVATARFEGPIKSSASILGEFLKKPPLTPDSTGQKLVPNRYIIIEQLNSAKVPDPKVLRISRFSSGFPVAHDPKDVDDVVVVFGRQGSVREYLNAGSDDQWAFTCFLIDLKSSSVVAESEPFYGSVPANRAGQPNGGASSSGTQPWNDVRTWLETIK